MSERIQKILASAGVGSRRQIEQWIIEGRIKINGAIAKLGDKMELTDEASLDGRDIPLFKSQNKKTRVLIYNKPEGEICSHKDPENRPTIYDRLPNLRHSKWITVGRLDFNTAGILLVTNNGELANRLMHPSANIEREYAVRVQGEVTPEMITRLKKGVMLEDGKAHFDSITDGGGTGSNHWWYVTVKEGKNRLVRRLWESQDLRVSRLIRIRFDSFTIPRMLKKGRWHELSAEEVDQLINS